MTLEELTAEWRIDSKLDFNKLTQEALNISQLHSKYYDIYMQEKARFFKLDGQLKQLKLDKYEFYTLGPTEETRNKGWRLPPQGKILKAEVQQFIDADQDVIDLTIRLGMQKEKCNFIEAIINSLNSRGWNIKTILEIEKWKAGF